jgi:deoxyribodipyrimidine photolyase
MSDLILFWHRRDLRISDNIGLAAARQESPKVVGIFCLDRNILNPDEVAPARVTYMIGCLQKLSSRYRESGSQLLIIQDDPSLGIPKLATAINAKAVFWNWDVEPYAKKRDRPYQTPSNKQEFKSKISGIKSCTPQMNFAAVQGNPTQFIHHFGKNGTANPKPNQ